MSSALGGARDLARGGRLYPAVILHGGDDAARREGAFELARTLLCAAPAGERPCGGCRHCRRLAPAARGGDAAPFHPDFHLLERDLKTATSVEATRGLLREAQSAPFEARGQVFVVPSAQTLSPEAANALLKILEEPPDRAPRHFLLLAPSQYDLLPTLRSRSLPVYLGPAARLPADEVHELAASFGARARAWAGTRSPVWLLAAAEALGQAGGWEDPRAERPWCLAAAAVREAARDEACPPPLRRALLALAESLLEGTRLRVRGIPAERILEGLVARHLA
jgi:hypothetical protein